MELFAYCRVSGIDGERSTLENQVNLIEKYCQLNGHIIKEWFKDEGVSGASKDRPAFTRMMNQIDQTDGIVCTYLDRFGRSLEEVIMCAKIIEDKEKFMAFTEMNLDTKTAGGKLLFHVLAAYAEFERTLTMERLAIGRKLAGERGVKFGRKKIHIPKKELEALLESDISWASIGRIYGVDYRTVQARAEEYEII